jgi:hypothetical protein
MRWKIMLAAGLFALTLGSLPGAAFAQAVSRGRYLPLDQQAAPGVAGRWAGVQRGFVPVMHPVRIEVPGGGQVSIFHSPAGDRTDGTTSSLFALRVGSLYRARISDIPEFEGAEFYPTIELLDRLHPPRGRELEFPIPIVFTVDEITLALQGRLVTKVVYLEQPDRADPIRATDAARSHIARPRDNVLALADEAGRPMAIVRLGGRQPDAGAIDAGFFGTGAPVQLLQQAASAPTAVTHE